MIYRREETKVVICGHENHGKSAIIEHLMTDSGNLFNAKAVEHDQGMRQEVVRCFIQSEKRRYIIKDTPGDFEFLKNMVTRGLQAEVALLVLDARSRSSGKFSA